MTNFLMKHKFANFIVILIIIFAFGLPAGAGLIFFDSYESYDTGVKNFYDNNNPDKWKQTGVKDENNYYQVISSFARAGGKSIEYHSYRTSPNIGYRNQSVAWGGLGSGRLIHLYEGNEYWVGFSVYLPEDFVCDGCISNIYANELLVQFFGIPDDGETDARNPCVAFLVVKGNWELLLHSDSHPITKNKAYERTKKYTIGSWSGDTGKWTDWVFNFKVDYTAGGYNGGFFKVYKNGVLVVNDTGGNCYNDADGSYPSFGIYKFSWQEHPTDTVTRIVYLDEIKIGDKNSNLSEVSPEETKKIDSPKGLSIVHLK